MSNFFKENSFKNKTILITGGTGQLGSELKEAFSRLGGNIISCDVIKSENSLDISDRAAVDSFFDETFKSQKVDILINNAGVSCFENYLDRPEESFDWVMDVNLKGTFNCIRSFAQQLKSSGQRGNIVNIGSIYGVVSPDPRIYTDCDRKNSEVYGATKAGIIQMTKYFAVHLAELNIRVNCVSPGGIFNPNNPQGEDFIKNYSFRCPMKRMAECHEIVNGVLYLSSPVSSYVNGHNLVIDGGFSSW